MKKARNKKYKERIAAIPMMKETRDTIAIGIRSSFDWFISQPSRESLASIIRNILVLTVCVDQRSKTPIHARTDPSAKAIRDALAMAERADERRERTGEVTCSEADAEWLRGAANVLDVFLASVPYNVYLAAEQFEEHAMRQYERDKQAASIQTAKNLIALA